MNSSEELNSDMQSNNLDVDLGITENIDARPSLPISDKSLWHKAAERLDELAVLIDTEFKKENIIAWIRKSNPGEYPLFLEVNSWKKVDESELTTTFDRSSLSITISVNPYLESPLSYKVEIERQKQFNNEYWELSSDDVSEFTQYLIKGGEKPRFFKPHTSAIEGFMGMFIPYIGNPPENKLTRDARPNIWTFATILFLSGVLITVAFILAIINHEPSYPNYEDRTAFYLACSILGILAIFCASYISRHRACLDAIPKQPLRTPRHEFLIDSWHVSVPGAGEEIDQFRERLYNAVIGENSLIETNRELHQNLTPRGFEERERLVLTKGQASLHLHVYPFLKDAFVGWDSHLNWSRWGEGKSISATVRSDGTRINFKQLEVGVHVPTEFDLIEANVLAETTHRQLVKEVKAFLKEKEIEADLDFKIIRGDRSRALNEGKKDDVK